MKRDYCGLDFGTTNSAIGIKKNNQKLELVQLESGQNIVPSALFFDYDINRFFYGQVAKDKYIEGEDGRLLMSLKSILGSDTVTGSTHINGIEFNFQEIIGYIFRNIKEKAELSNGEPLTKVVLGRPVFFNENDADKDQRAQNILEKIAQNEGFEQIEFQFEPIAAALAYENTIHEEQIALIIDVGGGTSDFSIIRLSPDFSNSDRSNDIIANSGVYIGGNTFDRLISIKNVMPFLGKNTTYQSTTNTTLEMPTSLYNDFATWHRINNLYQEVEKEFVNSVLRTASDPIKIKRFLYALEYELGHTISGLVENGKIKASTNGEANINFDLFKEAFTVLVDYQNMVADISEKTHEIRDLVKELIATAGISSNRIDTIFFTGGSTKIEAVRSLISTLIPNAKIVEGDAFGSVALGLTIDAKNRFENGS